MSANERFDCITISLQIGDILKEKYDAAHEMLPKYKIKRNGKKKFMKLVPKFPEFKTPTPVDIIYFEDSPNFCERDRRLGLSGTKGRECNISSSEPDGCDLMCCRRGFNHRHVAVVEQCKCKFVWCCKVQCHQCTRIVSQYTCK